MFKRLDFDSKRRSSMKKKIEKDKDEQFEMSRATTSLSRRSVSRKEADEKYNELMLKHKKNISKREEKIKLK